MYAQANNNFQMMGIMGNALNMDRLFRDGEVHASTRRAPRKQSDKAKTGTSDGLKELSNSLNKASNDLTSSTLALEKSSLAAREKALNKKTASLAAREKAVNAKATQKKTEAPKKSKWGEF